MADENTPVAQEPVSQEARAEVGIESISVEKKGWLKGSLIMAICCAAPLLLLAAIPFLAATFGSLAAVGSSLLSVVALLACPVGMYLMMRMMTNDKK